MVVKIESNICEFSKAVTNQFSKIVKSFNEAFSQTFRELLHMFQKLQILACTEWEINLKSENQKS